MYKPLLIKIILTVWFATPFVFADEKINTVSASLSKALSSVMAQSTAVGSVAGHSIRRLSFKEFERFKLNNTGTGSIGIWQGLISHLQSENPRVHIIDTHFYSNPSLLGFQTRYGTHEAYARFNGLAKNSSDFLKKVVSLGDKKSLMPFTLHIPNGKLPYIQGRPIHWIFQNRRYKYTDKPNDFVNILNKSQQAVLNHLFPKMGDKFQVTFMTYQKKKSFQRPNLLTVVGQKDISLLRKLKFGVMSEQDLEVFSNRIAEQITVLNPSSIIEGNNTVSYGYLQHITNNSDNSHGAGSINHLSVKDIAIFDELPERVSPVAGIIVLEKQTEFSHIDLLARNRGMMNISLSTNSKEIKANQLLSRIMKGFSPALYGQAVKIEVNNKNALSISLSTKQKVDNFYKKQRKRWGSVKIQKPVIVDEKRWLLNPAKEHLAVNQVGAKAANYGLIQNRLTGSGLVLSGRAIGFNLYLKTLELEGDLGRPKDIIQKLISEKDSLSIEEIDTRLREIQKAILTIPYTKIPKTMAGISIVDEMSELLNSADYKDVGRIRFRSSTNCEDLPSFNGAGLYQSKGFTAMKRDTYGARIINGEKMWTKLKKVLASLWLSRAFLEREYFGIDHHKAAMAIQINPAFSDKWLNGVAQYEWGNGVILYNEKKGKHWFRINSQIGEYSVSNPIDGALPESLTFLDGKLKTIERRAEIEGASQLIFLAKDKDTLPEKSHLLLEILMNGAEDIYHMMIRQRENSKTGFTVDIEFKIMFDKVKQTKNVFIKQARLLSVLEKK